MGKKLDSLSLESNKVQPHEDLKYSDIKIKPIIPAFCLNLCDKEEKKHFFTSGLWTVCFAMLLLILPLGRRQKTKVKLYQGEKTQK